MIQYKQNRKKILMVEVKDFRLRQKTTTSTTLDRRELKIKKEGEN